MDYEDNSRLIHATVEQRFIAKLIDFVIVSVIVLAFYEWSETIVDHCVMVVLFYIIFYQTLLDGLGGTIGKRIVGIYPIDESKMRPLTLLGSIKRLGVTYFMGCLVVPIFLNLLMRADKDAGYRSWADYICRIRSVYSLK